MSNTTGSGFLPPSGPTAGSGGSTPGGASASGDGSCSVGDPGCGYGSNSPLTPLGGALPPEPQMCCLAQGTLVPLANGAAKRAEEIEIGDELLGKEDQVETVTALIGGMQESIALVTSLGELKCSQSHLLLGPDGECVEAKRLGIGCEVLSGTGDIVEIIRVTSIGNVQVYGWTCEPSHLFQAANYLHHNKSLATNQPPISGVTNL